MSFNPRWIVGKIVERVEMNPTPDGRGGVCHGPRIFFTNGTSIAFMTEETDHGEYGTDIIYTPRGNNKSRWPHHGLSG